MEVLMKVVYFLTIQAIVLMDSAAADPGISISPSEISLGISSTLDINCTFSLKNHADMAALVSLNLLRANASGQNFEELAVISEFNPDSVNMETQEKVSATGNLSQTQQSFLRFTWEYPTAAQGGVYECAAHGLNMLGQMMDLVNTSVVTVVQANLTDIFEKLKQMENHEKSMENTIFSMRNTISSMENASFFMENTISYMRNTITFMENHIQNLENKVTSLTARSQLDYIGTYGDKEYYVSKSAFRDINESETTCKLLDGTMIEIDDENEYNAVIKLLKTVDLAITQIYVMIGGTDEATEGEWLLPSTNQPLPYTAWHSGQPSCTTSCNCLVLFDFRNNQETMADVPCHYNPPNDYRRFSCEIPSV